MKYWLVVYILLNGVWTPGAEVKPAGWSPRAYPSLAVCEKRRRFAEKAVKGVAKAPSKWFCTRTPDAPLSVLEAEKKARAKGR
ncbi:hypothetical protein [Thermopetrobacter sp. TC1]|uniref:hypothetical protein n=1 Tax=Thermopetrobacter sp. TC1 TaxID=1495045 RepID=UPI000571B133|nr:hypothetical protein [Thermopetrobacter sp. TC1]